MPLISHNPATGQDIQVFDELTDSQIQEKIAVAQSAFESWKFLEFAERKVYMKKLAEVLRKNNEEYAQITTREIGRPITQSRASIKKCAWVCDYYADNTEKILAHEIIKTEFSESFVQFDPLGIIFAVMPWNYPFWQVMRFLAPALMAGNVGLLKHASNVPQSALAIERAVLEAGFPAGVFQSLLISSSKVDQIVADDRIKAVTLTGSERAGSLVASQAARLIKKAVLELGGSDPFIVLSDADIPRACEIATTARLQNAGQSCISAKRFIVMEDRYEEFLELYKERFSNFIVGDPLDEKTQLGPVVSQASLEDLQRQVNQSVEKGTRLIYGGKRIDRPGYFFEPTILADVKKGMAVYDEETFGPVSAVIKVSSIDEAIAVANDTPFGLGSSIWTQDIELAKKLAQKIDVGAVFINSMVKSDPRLPFGGVKKSGYGRELSDYGIKEFVNIKTIVVST